MANESRQKLFKAINKAGFDIGSYNDFDRRMNNAEDRQKFFEAVNNAGYDIGSQEEFERRISPSKYKLNIGGKITPVSEFEYLDFQKRHPSGLSAPAQPVSQSETPQQPQQQPQMSEDFERTLQAPVATQPTPGTTDYAAPTGSWVDQDGRVHYAPATPKPKEGVSSGVPFRKDLSLAERAEIERQNNYAVREMDRLREEERRRQQPLVDTGSEGANKYVVRSEGDWEDDLQQGAKRISNAVVAPAVDKAISEFDKKAHEVFESNREGSNAMGGYATGTAAGAGIFGVLRESNKAKDPEKILNYLKQQMEGLYNNDSFIEEISKEADRMGIDRETYLEKVIKPQIQQDLISRFDNTMISKYLPKSGLEYVMNGLGDSIFGMISNAFLETKGQREYKNRAEAMTEMGQNPNYTPGTGASLARMGVSFAADAPFFGLTGRVGAAVVKKVAEREIKRMMAKGLSESAARSIVGSALQNSVGARMKNYLMQHVISSGVTLGGYNAISEGARQMRDSEFDPLKLAGRTAEGVATGAAFGVTGGMSQALSQPLTGISRVGAKLAGFGAEAETLYATEELSKMLQGDGGFENPFEGSAEALMKLGVMKVSSGHPAKAATEKIIRAKEVGVKQAAAETLAGVLGQKKTGVDFTKKEQSYIRDTADGKSLLDALSGMHPEKAISEVNGKKRMTPEGEQMRKALADSYNNFMSNPEYPATLKQKVAHVLGGVYRPGLETGADIIHNDDGSVILKTRDKDGNCIRELKFDSFSDADAWRENSMDEFALNDAVNMWNGTTNEKRSAAIDEVAGMFGISRQEAGKMVYDALDPKDTSLNHDQYSAVFGAIERNAYPKDEYNPSQRYSEGRKVTAQERHIAQTDVQVAEEMLELIGHDFAEEIKGATQYADEKMTELASRNDINGDQIKAAAQYYNAVAKMNGMMDEALKSVDEQVEAANAEIQRNTHPDSGALIEVTHFDGKENKNYYLSAGHIQITPDGKVVSSDGTGMVILRDKNTGEIKVMNPQSLTVTAVNDPKRMMEVNESMDGLRGQLMKQADDSIEFAPGTPETPQEMGEVFTGADGKNYMVAGEPDQTGNVNWLKIKLDENGDPVGSPQPLDIDEYRKAKSNEIDAANRPEQIAPEIEEPVPETPENIPNQVEYVPETPETVPNQAERADKTVENEQSQSALSRIPVDKDNNKLYEQASPEDALTDLTEEFGEQKAQQMIAQMVENTGKVLTALQQKDTSGMTDMNKIRAHEKEIADLQKKIDFWQSLIKKPEPVTEPKPVEKAPEAEVPKATVEPKPVEPKPVAEPKPEPPVEPAPKPKPMPEPEPVQQPSAEKKVAQGAVKNNIGKQFEFLNQDGTRSEITIKSFKGDDMVEVERQDYDMLGNTTGKPYSQDLKMVDVGNAIVNGQVKPLLSVEERLRTAFKGKIGMQNIIDVLSDEERQKMLTAVERNDEEALREMTDEFVESHREDLILNDRDKRNSNVNQIMEGTGSREEKLRRVRKEFQGYEDAVIALSDEALQPTTLEEYVADLHSRQPKSGEGPLAYFSYDVDGKKVVGMQDETGHGTKSGGDTKGYAPWLAPKGKGMSLQEYAENIHSQLPEAIQEQYSDQDVRNAILSVFGGDERPGDITTMVIRRGIIQAEQAARRMEEMWMDSGISYQKISEMKEKAGQPETKEHMVENEHPGFDSAMKQLNTKGISINDPELMKEYGLKDLTLSKTGDHVTLNKIVVADKGQGNGTRFMEDLARLADEKGWTLALTPSGGFGAKSVRRLKDFYKRFGFVDNKGRNPDFSTRESMIRRPKDYETTNKPEKQEEALRNAVVDHLRSRGIEVSDDWKVGQKILDEHNSRFSGEADSEPKAQKVTDQQTLDELNNGKTVKRYRAMQLIDGKLYPPMSAKVDGEMRQPTEIGVWEQAEERPDLVKNGKFVLNKAQKGQSNVPAAYNPYFHTSTSGLNDQFTSAYKRPELVVVEVEVPESELTSGYKAEGAKDAVGNVDWHSGVVNGQLPEDRQRQVTLSRYSKVNRVVPDSEVADMIAKQLEGTGVEVPYNVVTPQLRKELEARGVKISDKPAGSVTEDINGNPIKQQKAKEIEMKPIEESVSFNPGFEESLDIQDRVAQMPIQQVLDTYKRLNSQMLEEGGLNVDEHEDKIRREYISEHGIDKGLGKAMADHYKYLGDKYGYGKLHLRWELLDRLEKEGIDPDGATVIPGNTTAKLVELRPRYFKTKDGHAYGYTYRGKIYLDPRIATSETPIHEYGHLWSEMKRQTSPEEWNHIKQVMLTDKLVQPIIDKVRNDYPELTKEGKEDDFIEEIITQFSGKRGTERLREIAQEVAQENGGIFGKAEAVTAMQRLKNILNRFWEGVAKMMGWKYRNANQIADRIMADMLNGVNPRDPKSAASSRMRTQQKIERTLMAVHNISEDKLRKALKLGGLANPSMAVIDTNQHMHSDYGEISLIPRASMIDASTGRNAGTFTADAWTPSYPKVEKRMSDKGQSKFWKDLKKLNEDAGEMAQKMRMAFDTWLDHETGEERMAYWYLKDKGLDPELVKYKSPYSQEMADRFEEMTERGHKDIRELSDDELKEVADMYHAYKESIGEPVTPAEERIKKMEMLDLTKETPFTQLRRKRLEDLKKYGEAVNTLREFVDGVRRYAYEDGKVDAEATIKKAFETMQSKNLQDDFKAWLDQKAEDYGIEEWLYNGTDSQGRHKYVRNTLENASRLMKKEGLNGAVGWSSIGSWIATVANKEKTLEGIRRNKKNLNTTVEEHDAWKENWGNRLYPIVEKLGNGDPFHGDNIMKDILEHKDYAGYYKREYGKELTKDDIATIDEFIKEVRNNFPTGYFETKFERPVQLDEFEIAVVPESTSPDIIDALKQAGLDVRTYDTSDYDTKEDKRRQAAMEAVSGRDDIRFQMVGRKGAKQADKAEGQNDLMDNLKLAEQAEKEGMDAHSIKFATGWERGKDGQWRYETPDADVDILKWYKDAVHAANVRERELYNEYDRLTEKWQNLQNRIPARLDNRYTEEQKEKYREMRKEATRLFNAAKAKRQEWMDYANSNADGLSTTLEEVIGKDNELFKYYPQLREMKVKFGGLMGSAGSYDTKDKFIKINPNEFNRFDERSLNSENVYGTLIHEIQHAVQDIEGFAQGGSLESAVTPEGLKAIIGKKEEQIKHLTDELDSDKKVLESDEFADYAELAGMTEERYREFLNNKAERLAGEIDTLKSQIERIKKLGTVSRSDAMEFYRSLSGEVEARNATRRMNMTDEERMTTLAEETEDTPRDKQVVIVGDGKSESLQAGTDKQGNPVDEDGKLITEKVEKIDDITDDDFNTAVRSVCLPSLPPKVDNAIGANGRPVIIKKNIFERNKKRHSDLTPEMSRDLLKEALYNTKYYTQNQKITKPHNWIVISLPNENGDYRTVLLEVDNHNDNLEIVHWHYVDDHGIEKIKRQAQREGGQFLMLPSEEEAGALSSRTLNLSGGKDTKNIDNFQENPQKSAIQGLEDYSEQEINKYVREFVKDQIEMSGADAEIVDIKVIGSRTNGTAKPDSDLDVLLEFKGKEREDDMFNMLAEADEPLVINGIKVDINPIKAGKSGTIAEFLERNKDYRKENESDSFKFQNVSNPEPEMTAEERQYWNKWSEDMRKWREQNAIAEGVEGPGEKPKFRQGENAMDFAKRLVAYNRDKALWQTAPRLDDYRVKREDKDLLEAARENEKRYPDSPSAKMRRAAAEFQQIRRAMSQQKAYDRATVKAVVDFANDYMKEGFGDHLGRGEIERLLSSVKNATGAKDIRKYVDNIMNILTDNYLRNLDQRVVKLSSVKELSKTAQGVEKQGKLELKGQRMIQAFREAREGRMDADKIRERMAEVAEKMGRDDDDAPMWEQEYEGLGIALQYAENIEASRDEYADLDREYRDAVKNYKDSGRSYKAQQELLESLEQAMMENKIERIGMFGDIINRLEGNIAESIEGAREFVEREKQRVKHIQQIANFDLAGKPAYTSRREDRMDRLLKNDMLQLAFSPLATFEQMLKQFGSKNVKGEGHLYNYFMNNYINSVDNAYTGTVKAREELDAKAKEIFGDKVKHWSDLYKITSKPGMDITYLDGENEVTDSLSQGNMLYIYMANKMSDGKMKLRKMGITEEDVDAIKDALDPRLVELGDWLQSEYLPKKRTEYNKVHERMFGAPMAAIENYFPIKVNRDAAWQDADKYITSEEGDKLPSSITGSIIKRTRNALPLDILHTDALSLAMEHIEDMEQWKSQAEFNRDVKDLLSYTTFRNKVKNMKTIYGSGTTLWNKFFDAATIATGDYNPKRGVADKTITNIAKGVTSAKINFRVYTALKQLLSMPAFFHDVKTSDMAKAMLPHNYFYNNFKWAMENMPVFRKRWESRQIGDTRLMDDPSDWKIWKKNWMQKIQMGGMITNATIDALTCAAGAKAIYDTRYAKYKKMGASDEIARKVAIHDAEIGYNLTQQSSEGAFVSAIQKDRTVAANALSVFRNGPFSYTRQAFDAMRNLKKMNQKGYKEDSIEFMTRQFQDKLNLDKDQARKAAEMEYAKAGRHEFAKMLNMMFGVTALWNMGASLPYLIFGDDDETRKEMLIDAIAKSLAAGPVEGLAGGNIWSDLMGRTLSEETRKAFNTGGIGSAFDSALKQAGDYEVNPLPLMADIQSMIKKMKYDKYAAAQDVFNIAAQSYTGVNPQTITDIWNAAMDYGNPSWMPFTDTSKGNDDLTNSKEIALFIMRVLNAPTSSWRNKYIDELGMNAEDAKKLSYDEMAKRYANYKHWKDAPIMGWLRSDEERQAKMDKIQKQFDEAVEERMNRLTDEELMHNVARSESAAEKRKYAKIIAQKLGLSSNVDSEKPADNEVYQKIYQRQMLYEDIREDEMLASKYKELENAYKEKYEEAMRKSAIDVQEFVNANKDWKSRIDEAKKEADKRINWIRGGKWDTPSGKKGNSKKASLLAPGKKQLESSDDTETIMKNIRQWRKEALEMILRAESGDNGK